MSKSANNSDKCCDPNIVISEFYDKIQAFVSGRVKDSETVRDITQEVMSRMIEAYNKNASVLSVKSWIYQVTKNVIADHYRRNSTILDNDSSNDLVDDYIPGISEEDFIIPMIKLLPKEYSEPIYLSDIENLKHSEIAEKLNLSLSAVKMRCKRARQKLYEMFQECCDIEYTKEGQFASCTIKGSCHELLKLKHP